MSGGEASRTFNPNDLGYLTRADERRWGLGFGRTFDATWSIFRNWKWSASTGETMDQAGKRIGRNLGFSLNTDTLWSWAIWLNGGASLPVYDDRELRTFSDPVKKYLRTTRVPYLNFGWDTAGNQPWYVRIDLRQEWQEGGNSYDLKLSQTIKLGHATELQLESSSTRDAGERKYFTNQDGVPLVALRKLGQFNQTFRISHAFTPQLTLQAFSQWLVGNWNYRDFKAYASDDLLRPVAPKGSTSASGRYWNVNLIGRWEFKPGSTCFLVYTHGVNTDQLVNTHGTVSPRRDLPILSSLPSDDVLQVKFSYLFR